MTKRYGNRMEAPQRKLKEDIKATMDSWSEKLRKNPSTRDAEVNLSPDGELLQITTKDAYLRIVVQPEAAEVKPYSLYAFNSKQDFIDAQNPRIPIPKTKKEIEDMLGI